MRGWLSPIRTWETPLASVVRASLRDFAACRGGKGMILYGRIIFKCRMGFDVSLWIDSRIASEIKLLVLEEGIDVWKLLVKLITADIVSEWNYSLLHWLKIFLKNLIGCIVLKLIFLVWTILKCRMIDGFLCKSGILILTVIFYLQSSFEIHERSLYLTLLYTIVSITVRLDFL